MSNQETKVGASGEHDLANFEKTNTSPSPPDYNSPGYPGPPQVGQPPGSNSGPPAPQYPTVIQTAPTMMTGVGVPMYPGGVTVMSTVGTVGGAVIMSSPVGPHPTNITCRSCNMVILTKIQRKPILMTHMVALGLCLVGCCPCALIPYFCTDSCKGYDHYCPHCDAYIGSYPYK